MALVYNAIIIIIQARLILNDTVLHVHEIYDTRVFYRVPFAGTPLIYRDTHFAGQLSKWIFSNI